MLAFLERNVHKCPRHVKENCFNALVRPLVQYASSVWDPHKQTQIDKLEKKITKELRDSLLVTTYLHMEIQNGIFLF